MTRWPVPTHPLDVLVNTRTIEICCELAYPGRLGPIDQLFQTTLSVPPASRYTTLSGFVPLRTSK